MITLHVPPEIFPQFFGIIVLLCYSAFLFGKPGGGRVKKTLMGVTSLWAVILIFQALVFIFEETTNTAPLLIQMFQMLSCIAFIISCILFYYAILEKERDWFHDSAIAVCIGCLLAVFTSETFYTKHINRSILFVIFTIYGWGGSMIVLLNGYRKAKPNTTKKKRIYLVLMSVVVQIFLIWFPIQLVATDIMGWFTDRQLVGSVVVIMLICGFMVFIAPLVSRYNLVKVQLDEVGEGLFRNIDTPVILLSKEQKILRANPKATDLFFVDELFSKPEKERLLTSLVTDYNDGETSFDTALETQKGLREFECTLSSVYQMDEILGSILIFHDVTREREVARMKTEFTSTVSHELRTPLTSILGFAKIIDRRFKDVILPTYKPENKKSERAVKQINKNLGVIISESNRLTALINDVLDISKMEAGKIDWRFAKCNPKHIIEQAINATSGLFTNDSIRLVQQIPDDLSEVVADSDRVVQVIINLISNAVKFTDEGTITVKVEQEWSNLSISVIDTGSGISEENQKLVFEKYKQVGEITTDKPKGTGLGLPISKEIVEYHGGRIWVESTVGVGSVFAFTLPLANVIDTSDNIVELEGLAQHLEKMTAPIDSTRPTVLVIDDESSIREVLKQMLEEYGFSVLEAVDGVDGLKVVRENKPDFIILDVMMPRLNGFDCAAALKADKSCRHIPIMMLTVIEDAQRAYGLGVETYITKPFEPSNVLEEVNKIINKRANQQSVVVLGQCNTQDAVYKMLEESRVTWTQVTDVAALKDTISENNHTLVIVVDAKFQEKEIRLEIQKIAGTNSCLVLHISGLKTPV